MSDPARLAVAVVALCLAFAVPVGSAAANPAPCAGAAVPVDDGLAGDQTNPFVEPADTNGSTDVVDAFMAYDPAGGSNALTFDVRVDSLSTDIATGWTTKSWEAYFTAPDGSVDFVQATLDLLGNVAYEYGRFVPNPGGRVGVAGALVGMGETSGRLFLGPAGVVQMVVPMGAFGLAPGDTLRGLYVTTHQGDTLPAVGPAPNRGQSWLLDTAPDDAPPVPGGDYVIAGCPTT